MKGGARRAEYLPQAQEVWWRRSDEGGLHVTVKATFDDYAVTHAGAPRALWTEIRWVGAAHGQLPGAVLPSGDTGLRCLLSAAGFRMPANVPRVPGWPVGPHRTPLICCWMSCGRARRPRGSQRRSGCAGRPCMRQASARRAHILPGAGCWNCVPSSQRASAQCPTLPIAVNSSTWLMWKLGQPISPLEVIRNGSHGLHAVGDEGISVDSADGRRRLHIRSLDAAVVSPGRHTPFPSLSVPPELLYGASYCLSNNIWGEALPGRHGGSTPVE